MTMNKVLLPAKTISLCINNKRKQYRFLPSGVVIVGILFLYFLLYLFLLLYLLLLVLYPMLLLGEVELSELYGTYTAEYKFAREKLTLSKDGTYTQDIFFKESFKLDTISGKWNYSIQNDSIGFDKNYLNVLEINGKFNTDYKIPKKGLTVLPVGKVFGRIRISHTEYASYKKRRNLKNKN